MACRDRRFPTAMRPTGRQNRSCAPVQTPTPPRPGTSDRSPGTSPAPTTRSAASHGEPNPGEWASRPPTGSALVRRLFLERARRGETSQHEVDGREGVTLQRDRLRIEQPLSQRAADQEAQAPRAVDRTQTRAQLAQLLGMLERFREHRNGARHAALFAVEYATGLIHQLATQHGDLQCVACVWIARELLERILIGA